MINMKQISIGEYKYGLIMGSENVYVDEFLCSECGLKYVYYGKGFKQFKKMLRDKGCHSINGNNYCWKCWYRAIRLALKS